MVAAGEPLRRCAAWTRAPLFLAAPLATSRKGPKVIAITFPPARPFAVSCRLSTPGRARRHYALAALHLTARSCNCARRVEPLPPYAAPQRRKSRARSHTRKQAQRTRSRGFGRGGERWGHLTDCICNTRLYDVSTTLDASNQKKTTAVVRWRPSGIHAGTKTKKLTLHRCPQNRKLGSAQTAMLEGRTALSQESHHKVPRRGLAT